MGQDKFPQIKETTKDDYDKSIKAKFQSILDYNSEFPYCFNSKCDKDCNNERSKYLRGQCECHSFKERFAIKQKQYVLRDIKHILTDARQKLQIQIDNIISDFVRLFTKTKYLVERKLSPLVDPSAIQNLFTKQQTILETFYSNTFSSVWSIQKAFTESFSLFEKMKIIQPGGQIKKRSQKQQSQLEEQQMLRKYIFMHFETQSYRRQLSPAVLQFLPQQIKQYSSQIKAKQYDIKSIILEIEKKEINSRQKRNAVKYLNSYNDRVIVYEQIALINKAEIQKLKPKQIIQLCKQQLRLIQYEYAQQKKQLSEALTNYNESDYKIEEQLQQPDQQNVQQKDQENFQLTDQSQDESSNDQKSKIIGKRTFKEIDEQEQEEKNQSQSKPIKKVKLNLEQISKSMTEKMGQQKLQYQVESILKKKQLPKKKTRTNLEKLITKIDQPIVKNLITSIALDYNEPFDFKDINKVKKFYEQVYSSIGDYYQKLSYYQMKKSKWINEFLNQKINRYHELLILQWIETNKGRFFSNGDKVIGSNKQDSKCLRKPWTCQYSKDLKSSERLIKINRKKCLIKIKEYFDGYQIWNKFLSRQICINSINNYLFQSIKLSEILKDFFFESSYINEVWKCFLFGKKHLLSKNWQKFIKINQLNQQKLIPIQQDFQIKKLNASSQWAQFVKNNKNFMLLIWDKFLSENENKKQIYNELLLKKEQVNQMWKKFLFYIIGQQIWKGFLKQNPQINKDWENLLNEKKVNPFNRNKFKFYITKHGNCQLFQLKQKRKKNQQISTQWIMEITEDGRYVWRSDMKIDKDDVLKLFNFIFDNHHKMESVLKQNYNLNEKKKYPSITLNTGSHGDENGADAYLNNDQDLVDEKILKDMETIILQLQQERKCTFEELIYINTVKCRRASQYPYKADHIIDTFCNAAKKMVKKSFIENYNKPNNQHLLFKDSIKIQPQVFWDSTIIKTVQDEKKIIQLFSNIQKSNYRWDSNNVKLKYRASCNKFKFQIQSNDDWIKHAKKQNMRKRQNPYQFSKTFLVICKSNKQKIIGFFYDQYQFQVDYCYKDYSFIFTLNGEQEKRKFLIKQDYFEYKTENHPFYNLRRRSDNLIDLKDLRIVEKWDEFLSCTVTINNHYFNKHYQYNEDMNLTEDKHKQKLRVQFHGNKTQQFRLQDLQIWQLLRFGIDENAIARQRKEYGLPLAQFEPTAYFSKKQKHRCIQLRRNKCIALNSLNNWNSKQQDGFILVQKPLPAYCKSIRFQILAISSYNYKEQIFEPYIGIGLGMKDVIKKNKYRISQNNNIDDGCCLFFNLDQQQLPQKSLQPLDKIQLAQKLSRYSQGDVIKVEIKQEENGDHHYLLFENETRKEKLKKMKLEMMRKQFKWSEEMPIKVQEKLIVQEKLEMKRKLTKQQWDQARFCVYLKTTKHSGSSVVQVL